MATAKAKRAARARPPDAPGEGAQALPHTNGAVVQPGEHGRGRRRRHKALARNGLVEPPAGSPVPATKSRVPGALTHGSFQPRRRSLTGGE
jgi:hypothetical protein